MAIMQTSLNAVACVVLLALSACATVRNEPHSEPSIPAPGELEIFQTGVASWYGDDFHGKTTANGEVYDMHKLTAAHQNLPFHTIVEVENLENGKRVRVRINDRGPFLKERIIDLSLQAAQRLGMQETGTAEVVLRVVHWGGSGPDGGEPSAVARGCFVQVGAFSLRENADDMLLTLEEIFPDLAFRIVVENGMSKVVSPALDAAACREVLKKLAAYRLEGFIREDAMTGEN